MSIQVIQEVAGTAMSSSPGTMTATVTAGSLLHLWIGSDASIASVWTIKDTLNGNVAWTKVFDSGGSGDGNYRFTGWMFNGTAGGSTTITATSSPATDDAVWRLIEISGAATGNPADGTGTNFQMPPGTGTDAVTTGTVTNANQPALLVAMCCKQLTPAASAGTGFTAGGTDTSTTASLTTESKRVTNTSGTAATFTTPDGPSDASSMAIFYDELAGPIINTQPQNATCYVGQTPSFSVTGTASTGGGSLSYQWQLNGVNDGTNSSSYSPSSPMTLGDNGDRVQVLVTDSNGTTPSAFASIRVLPLPPSKVSAGDGLIGGRDGGRRLAN